MIDFSLERLKSKVARRMSELSAFEFPSILDRPVGGLNLSVIDTEPQRLRASSLSHPALSGLGRNSVSKKHTKALIRQETASVVLKKLLNLLAELGLQLPIPLKTSGSLSGVGPASRLVMVHLCNTNDSVYLPPALSMSSSYEDEDNGSGNNLESPEATTDGWASTGDDSDSTCLSQAGVRPFHLPNYLCSPIDSCPPIPHLFGVIVELVKPTCVKNVRVELLLEVVQMWPTGDAHNRFQTKDRFTIGALEWNLLLDQADYYISTSNSNDSRSTRVSPEALSSRTRNYLLVDIQELAEGGGAKKKPRLSFSDSTSDPTGATTSNETLKAGIYAFLLPVVFPSQIPASVTSINGLLDHHLSVNVARVSEKIMRRSTVSADFNLLMARTPPSLANSTADKPIYVNKTWNDALNYVVTFPRKYVALGSEHTVNLKLIPLVKDVIVKRIKFNVLERITYVSRDLTREYDYDSEDPLNVRGCLKIRERVVPLCELKTKLKSLSSGLAEPFKEVVIKCPDNNLLYSCYESEELYNSLDPLAKRNFSELVMIASPLDINVALPFLTTKIDKSFKPSYDETDNFLSVNTRRSSTYTRANSVLSAVCPSSPIIGSLETHISHINGSSYLNSDLDEDQLKRHSTEMMLEESNRDDNYAAGYTTTAKALAPDSNFRHIKISHRLQICFRISKPDPKDNYRMHHYEVVIDTPLVLLSARCNDESTQLPRYNDIGTSPSPAELRGVNFRNPSFSGNGVKITRLDGSNTEPLPSFEEATSSPTSPIMRSVSIGEDGVGSTLSSSPSDPAPAYEEVDTNYSAPEIASTLSIDDLVLDLSVPESIRRASLIKASLQNSFARSDTPRSRSGTNASLVPSSMSDESAAPREELDTLSFIVPGSILSSTDDDSLEFASMRLPVKSVSEVLGKTSNTGDLGMLADEDNSPEDSSNDDESSAKSLHADNASVFTQDTNFGQRIPLLTMETAESVPLYGGQPIGLRLIKGLTDTLDKPVDLYHAC